MRFIVENPKSIFPEEILERLKILMINQLEGCCEFPELKSNVMEFHYGSEGVKITIERTKA